jgi:hypothetical protein
VIAFLPAELVEKADGRKSGRLAGTPFLAGRIKDGVADQRKAGGGREVLTGKTQQGKFPCGEFPVGEKVTRSASLRADARRMAIETLQMNGDGIAALCFVGGDA